MIARKLLLFLLLSPMFSFGQTQAELDGILDSLRAMGGSALHFSKVESIDGKDQKDLYFLARSFFAETFRSAQDVIQIQDEDTSTIGGRGSFSHTYKIGGGSLMPMFVTNNYTYFIKIQCKDGRYKIDISDFSLKSNDAFESVISLPENNEFYKEHRITKGKMGLRGSIGMYKPILTTVSNLFALASAYMNSKTTPDNEDW